MDDLTPLQLANEIATHEGVAVWRRYRGHDIIIGPGASGIHVSVYRDRHEARSTSPLHERSLWFDAREGGNPGMSNAIQVVRDIDTLIIWGYTEERHEQDIERVADAVLNVTGKHITRADAELILLAAI